MVSISNFSTFVVDHGEKMLKFAFSPSNDLKQSLNASHIKLSNSESELDKRKFAKMLINTALVALVTVVASKVIGLPFIFTGLFALSASATWYTYEHFVLRNYTEATLESKAKDAVHAVKNVANSAANTFNSVTDWFEGK